MAKVDEDRASQELRDCVCQLASLSNQHFCTESTLQVLELLEWLLGHLHLSYERLDGSTPREQRQAIVDRCTAAP